MKRRLSAIVPAAALAAIIGAAALGVWSLPAAFGQGAPTPFAIFWNITGVPPYTAVSTANPLPVTPIGGSGTPSTVVIGASGSAAVGITPVVSGSAEGTHVLKGSPGNLYDLYVTTGTTSGYLMAFNATTAPGDGAVTPIDCVAAPANATTSMFTSPGPPEVYSTGISVAFSSTGCFTKTVSATAFFHGRVE